MLRDGFRFNKQTEVLASFETQPKNRMAAIPSANTRQGLSGLKVERESRFNKRVLVRLFNNLVNGDRTCRLMIGLFLLMVLGAGCGTFVARRMIQPPNTYPSWLAPSAPVLLSFNENLLTNSPAHFADVGPPQARLQYRVVEPADYHLNVISTNWTERGEMQYQFTFQAETPRTNEWTSSPRGTVFLLHGYGLAEFSMVPWAWRLAQEGWRCVLVDLRGHGKSTGGGNLLWNHRVS